MFLMETGLKENKKITIKRKIYYIKKFLLYYPCLVYGIATSTGHSSDGNVTYSNLNNTLVSLHLSEQAAADLFYY